MRVIPTLLMDKNGGLVKTVRFGKRTYIGDPINAVRIFNEKEVDELVLLDIDATPNARGPNLALIEDIVSEAFMPVAYGGGVSSVSQMADALRCGVEKVVVNTAFHENPDLIGESAARFGSQSVVGCLDIRRGIFGGVSLVTHAASRKSKEDVFRMAEAWCSAGAGELLVYSVDRDGTRGGYDIRALKSIAERVEVPVIACGGAGCLEDFVSAHDHGKCSAVAAGSLFVYHSSTLGVLINYPTREELDTRVFSKLLCNQV